jgi:hypothetical protein
MQGRSGAKVVTNSVLVHRFSQKGDKIESEAADLPRGQAVDGMHPLTTQLGVVPASPNVQLVQASDPLQTMAVAHKLIAAAPDDATPGAQRDLCQEPPDYAFRDDVTVIQLPPSNYPVGSNDFMMKVFYRPSISRFYIRLDMPDGLFAPYRGPFEGSPYEKLHLTAADEPPWGEAVDGVQVRLRTEMTKWSMRETPTFRADVRAQGDHDVLLATVEGLGCELHFDGVKYRHPTNLTGVAYHNIKAWEHGFTFALHKQWTTIEGNKPLTLTPGKHTVRFGWAGYHPTTVNGGMIPDETHPVLLLSNPVEIEILAADAKPATQPDTNPGNRTVIDVHGGSVRIKSGDNTLEAHEIVLEQTSTSAAPARVSANTEPIPSKGTRP